MLASHFGEFWHHRGFTATRPVWNDIEMHG